ncbi:phage terminase large subunit [Haladaptatus sp. DFWS20]|uniref:phage terminase large subunit n=1 Tax=Haladaptatus sp. DFWS20 TaxID=3403467 RepID=UPI003EC0F779
MGSRPVSLELQWEPHDGQRTVLNESARFRIVAAGRRPGKSEMAAMALVVFACRHPESRCAWVSPTYKQSDIGWEQIRAALPETLVASATRSKPRSLELVNGSRIDFRSADRPDSIRGVGLDLLVLDEAAYVPEETWHRVLRPTLTDTEGHLLAISTPNGRNWFHDLFLRGQNDDDWTAYASFQYPTATNPYVSDSEIEEAEASVTQRVFAAEYRAEFTDNTGGVFRNVRECISDYDWEAYDGERPFRIGVDFARHHDYTVIIAVDATGTLVHFDRRKGQSWPQIQAAIERAYDQYPGRCRVDSTRDNKIVADLERAGVSVDPVTFSSQRKQALIENLVTRLEQRELTLPDILVLRHELQAFEYEVTQAGNVRYSAPSGQHDDVVDALALCCHEEYADTEPKRTARTPFA